MIVSTSSSLQGFHSLVLRDILAEDFPLSATYNHNTFTMRGLGRLSVRSAICKPRSIFATPRWQVCRSIYTTSDEIRPYGFLGEHEQQQRPHLQHASAQQSPQLQVNGHSGFLPVPFVTEHLAGAHHSTDLFSRLLKERIVAVYGPVEDRMVSRLSSQCKCYLRIRSVKYNADTRPGCNNNGITPLP